MLDNRFLHCCCTVGDWGFLHVHLHALAQVIYSTLEEIPVIEQS